jgi:hypothetical protein
MSLDHKIPCDKRKRNGHEFVCPDGKKNCRWNCTTRTVTMTIYMSIGT